VRDVRARSSAHSLLMSDDLPTFERPAIATSGSPGAGKYCGLAAEMMNFAERGRMTAAP
jgi:hypothetical protein